MSIRPARLDDLETILTIERAASEAPHWSAEDYRAAILSDGVRRRAFVWDDGAVLGFAVGALTASGEIESVVVARESRGQGIGRALCAVVIAWCRQAGAPDVMLEVRASSHAAIHLYTSLGFQPLARRAGYYRHPPEDALIMRLPLHESRGT